MVILSVILFIIFIFPLFLSISFYFNYSYKKLFFTIKIFGLRILNGFIKLDKEGIVIHYTNKKAIMFIYKHILDIKKHFKPLKDYHFIKFALIFDIGHKENLIQTLSISFLLNYLYKIMEWFFANSKPYLKINNKINTYENKNILNITHNSTIIFNSLMIFISLIKILMEKIIYAFTNKK